MESRPVSDIKSEDDDFELLEQKEIDPADYKKYDNVGHRILTPEYSPKEIDQAIFRLYSEELTFKESSQYGTLGFAWHTFEHKTDATKIILFNVVANNKNNRDGLICLDEALQYYKNTQTHHLTDKVKVIIPIGETLCRKHFRLLTVADDIQYYDSKSTLVSEMMRIFHPLWPAADTAFKEVNKRVKDQKEKPIGYIQQCSMFARETINQYWVHRDEVKQICDKNFPLLPPVKTRALGHQPYDEHTNCGPLVAYYALQIALGLSPADMKEEIPAIRARLPRCSQENSTDEEPKVTLYETPKITCR